MQIVPGLYSLGDKSGGRVRAYLIEDGNELTLIDTLVEPRGTLVLQELKAIGKSPRDIKRIVLTHAHQSHFGGLLALKNETGARVYCHEWEADIFRGKKKMEIPKTASLLPQRPLKLYPFQVGLILGLRMPQPCEVDENLKDGDQVGPLTVMHAPGHTPGCLAFYWPEKKALIAGDIVTTWPELSLGWPQLTLDNRQNRASVGKLCDMTDAEVLCVGHGDPIRTRAAKVMRDLVASAPKG